MKGIILAGGSGSRLHPLTKAVSKQLLPINDKPMIYYPLSVLMLAGIQEVLIISTPNDLPSFKRLFGSGENLGISISYKVQPSPDGLAQAFILGEDFIGEDDVCLILGDNVFYGDGFPKLLKESVKNVKNEAISTVFGYYVEDPKRYGVVEFDDKGTVLSIDEKPSNPKSNFAIVGLYLYPNSVIQTAKNVTPSKRGELEITSVNQQYLEQNKLKVKLLGRGYAWFDTGTHQSLLDASNFINTIEKRQGLKVSCLEEIAFKQGFINREQLLEIAKSFKENDYGNYLNRILEE
jgi:glucose-1-phosphate thymidylyltransferase